MVYGFQTLTCSFLALCAGLGVPHSRESLHGCDCLAVHWGSWPLPRTFFWPVWQGSQEVPTTTAQT